MDKSIKISELDGWRIEIWHHLQLWNADGWTRRTIGYFKDKKLALAVAEQNPESFTNDCLNPHLVLTRDGKHGFVIDKYSISLGKEIKYGEYRLDVTC
jgi:hypothetical protein